MARIQRQIKTMSRHYNFNAFFQRTTAALELHVKTDKRQFLIKRSCELLRRYDEYSRHLAITEWCKQFRLSEKVLKNYILGEEVETFTNTDRLREFLGTFIINENEISGQLYIERNGTQYTYDELTVLVEDEGLKTYNLKKLLNSANKNISVVNVINPLNDLFLKFKEDYKGEPVIHKLASCIKAYDFNDKEHGYYQKRLEFYLHKWLCKAAGQILHIGNNDGLLLWIEPFGGSGKSRLNEWLFSLPEMLEYYIKISQNESFMDMKGISKSKFAINWDELPLTKNGYGRFKSYISESGGQQYSAITKRYESYVRQVNFIGSTNHANRNNQPGFLLDDEAAMMRRIVSIEIDGQINYKKYLSDIDLRQLWGQAAHDILAAQQSENKKLLTWEDDWDELRHYNRKYVNKNADDPKLFLKHFIPGNKNDGKIIGALQMKQIIESKGIIISMNEYELGNLLSKCGYISGRDNKGKRGWWIKT